MAHTMIRVRDLEASLAFYIGLIGLREVRRKAIGEEATLVFLTDERGAYHLELTFNHDGRVYELGDQFGHLAFHVEDLSPVISEVERRGLPYRASRPELSSRYIFVEDPNGYEVEILERSEAEED
jgi:lactoylglutathione lyase